MPGQIRLHAARLAGPETRRLARVHYRFLRVVALRLRVEPLIRWRRGSSSCYDLCCDCGMPWHHHSVIAQHCNIADVRFRSVEVLCCHGVAIVRHRDSVTVGLSNILMLQHFDVAPFQHPDVPVFRCHSTVAV